MPPRPDGIQSCKAMQTPGDTRGDYARWMRRIGAVLVSLAVLCGYGLYTSVSSKLRIRNMGERSPGVITRYDSLAGHSFPVVRFRAFDGNVL